MIAFLAHLMDTDTASAAGSRAKSLRMFSAWGSHGGQDRARRVGRAEGPRPDKTIVPKLSEVELRDLIAACADKTLYGRRDEAMIRLAMEAGCQAEELVGMNLPGDLDRRRDSGPPGTPATFQPGAHARGDIAMAATTPVSDVEADQGRALSWSRRAH
jgi:integrase/recombinase XerD